MFRKTSFKIMIFQREVSKNSFFFSIFINNWNSAQNYKCIFEIKQVGEERRVWGRLSSKNFFSPIFWHYFAKLWNKVEQTQNNFEQKEMHVGGGLTVVSCPIQVGNETFLFSKFPYFHYCSCNLVLIKHCYKFCFEKLHKLPKVESFLSWTKIKKNVYKIEVSRFAFCHTYVHMYTNTLFVKTLKA